MPKLPTVFAAAVPQRMLLPDQGRGRSSDLALPAHQCTWSRRLPPEIIALIAEHVLLAAGSEGVLAMAGVCKIWRDEVLLKPLSPLARTLDLFRCRRVQPLGSEYLLTNIREHRVSVFDESFFISPVAQKKLLSIRQWPPTSDTPQEFARALFGPFPGLVFVRRVPVTASDRSLDRIHTWRATKHAHVHVYSPLFPPWFVVLCSRQHLVPKEQYWLPFVTPMPRVFDEAEGEIHPIAADDSHLWEFTVSEPIPEDCSGHAHKVANSLVFSFQGRSQRKIVGGGFPPGTTARATVLTIDTDRGPRRSSYPATTLPDGTVCHVFVREVSAIVVFFVDAEYGAEARAMWYKEAIKTRPYLKSPTWVGQRTYRWRGPDHILCAFEVIAFRQKMFSPVSPNTDMLFSSRQLITMARRAVGPSTDVSCIRFTSVFPGTNNYAGGFGEQQWSTAYAPIYYRFLAKKHQVARRFGKIHGGGHEIRKRILCNDVPNHDTVCTKFMCLWLASKLNKPVRDWRRESPAVTFFGTKAWFAWCPGQNREKVYDLTSGRYKKESSKTLYGFGRNPVRNNRLPAFLNNSHFANVRNYLAVKECIFGPPHRAICTVGLRPETMEAFVPDTSRYFADNFPVLSYFKDHYGEKLTAKIAYICRLLVETSAPLVQVPIAFVFPRPDTPGITRENLADGRSARVDTAWEAQETSWNGDGVRVTGSALDSAATEAPRRQEGERIPKTLKVSTEEGEFRVTVNHITKGFAGTDVCYGTIAAADVTAACGDNLLHIFPILEIAVNEEHSITTMGVCMTALDWVAYKLIGIDEIQRMSPHLIGAVSHMALVLTLPENGSERERNYTQMAEKDVRRRKERAAAHVNPFDAAPRQETESELRFKHPLSLDPPVTRRAFTMSEVSPLLGEYLQAIVAHIVLADNSDLALKEEGWLWKLNKEYILRVSSAFNRWAVYPMHYYNRVMLLSAAAEREMRRRNHPHWAA